jgi:hypothetical protein
MLEVLAPRRNPPGRFHLMIRVCRLTIQSKRLRSTLTRASLVNEGAHDGNARDSRCIRGGGVHGFTVTDCGSGAGRNGRRGSCDRCARGNLARRADQLRVDHGPTRIDVDAEISTCGRFQPPKGANPPVYAVQFVRMLVGLDISVEVSVLLGSAQPPGVPVASVVISPGSRIVVDALTKFGVQPVTLSMAAVAPMTPYLPTAISVSPEIEVSNIELLSAPYPGYSITLRNLGQKSVSKRASAVVIAARTKR